MMFYKQDSEEQDDLEQLLFMSGLNHQDYLKIYLNSLKDYIFKYLADKESSVILILENWVSMIQFSHKNSE